MTLENESYMHIPLREVSLILNLFWSAMYSQGKRLVQRHQLVYATLQERNDKKSMHFAMQLVFSIQEWSWSVMRLLLHRQNATEASKG